MGNFMSFSVPPTADDRIVKAMQTFNLNQKDIAVFWKTFKKHDATRSGVIATAAFYADILYTPRTIFCDGLFDLIEGADSEAIDFGEFVAAVTTYCFFEIPEILQFSFYVFDRDKNGYITREEMRLFVDAMHNSDMTTNVVYALDNIKYKKDGKFDFEEFRSMHAQFPSVLFPAFRLQSAMMTAIGGEGWWRRMKTELSMKKEDDRKREATKEQREKEEAYRYRDQQIRRHMGLIKYTIMPRQRKKYYEIYPLPRKYRILEQAEERKRKRAANKVAPLVEEEDLRNF